MSKVDKEYVDAQIASVEEKCQEHINAAVGQVNNQNPPLLTVTENASFPIGFTMKNGELIYYVNEDGLGAIALDLFVQYMQVKEKQEKKMRDEGKKTQDDWYCDIYNMNVKNWKSIRDDLGKYYENRNKDIDVVRTVLNRTEELKAKVTEQTKAIWSIRTAEKPTGVYMFGKHISGWFYYPFMILVFLLLWFFSSGYFDMREQAKQANVKLQVIRDDFGHHPPIKHVFEMLDSTFANPIPQKLQEKGEDE